MSTINLEKTYHVAEENGSTKLSLEHSGFRVFIYKNCHNWWLERYDEYKIIWKIEFTLNSAPGAFSGILEGLL
jgi:hypothetical protein